METTQQNSQSSSNEASTHPYGLIEVSRDFNVPVARLFAAFKTPEAIKAWWWPNGLYPERVEVEFREGGKYFINMRGDQTGNGMTGKFQEIIENQRIVMTDQFADENGQPISAEEAKMPGTWPEVVYITYDFEYLGAEKSRLKMAQDGIPNELQKDCKQGWTEMFDKLEDYLAGRRQ